jgi:hypothetical protein
MIRLSESGQWVLRYIRTVGISQALEENKEGRDMVKQKLPRVNKQFLLTFVAAAVIVVGSAQAQLVPPPPPTSIS